MQPLPRYALVVAGGSGSRMGASVPKQFLPLNGLPVLMRTLNVFGGLTPSVSIVLVLPQAEHQRWEMLCKQHNFNIEHTLVSGGETRFHSVQNGLRDIQVDGLVAIHDGVRPLVTPALIQQCFTSAALNGSAVPAVRPHETIRIGSSHSSRSEDRSRVWLVQTPQVFRVSELKRHYQTPWSPHFTDDASVVEANGEHIHMVEGERENIKITTPVDMAIAQAILELREGNS